MLTAQSGHACSLFQPVDFTCRSAGLQYSLDMWVEQLEFFIKEVIYEAEAVYVAGNSLGGLLAVSVAYRHPEVRLTTTPSALATAAQLDEAQCASCPCFIARRVRTIRLSDMHAGWHSR